MITFGLTLICIALACFMALYAFRSQDLEEENTSLCLQLADKIKAEKHLFENLRSAEQEIERLIVYSKQRFGEYADKLQAAEAELASEHAIAVALDKEIKLVRAESDILSNILAAKREQSDTYAKQLDAIQEILNPSQDQT